MPEEPTCDRCGVPMGSDKRLCFFCREKERYEPSPPEILIAFIIAVTVVLTLVYLNMPT